MASLMTVRFVKLPCQIVKLRGIALQYCNSMKWSSKACVTEILVDHCHRSYIYWQKWFNSEEGVAGSILVHSGTKSFCWSWKYKDWYEDKYEMIKNYRGNFSWIFTSNETNPAQHLQMSLLCNYNFFLL